MWENLGSQGVQQTGIQCFNCKEFGHFAKECRKPKRVKDSTYHKEKMLLCKQAEKGVPLQAEQSDWLANTDSGTHTEPLEHVHNDAEYNVFANVRQHSEQPESTSNTCLVEKDDSNVTPDSPDMCDNDIQTDQNAEDECATLCKSILVETSKTLRESNSIRDSCLIALQNKQTEFERYKALNDRIVDYDKLKLVKEKRDELVKLSLLTKSHFEGLVKEKIKIPYDQSDPANRLIPDREETLTLEKESRSKLNKDLVRPYCDTPKNQDNAAEW
ncbi:integrase, catalytic region, zinc finger, CCHC-type containing protein [Tanacetum coccineum]